MFMEAGQAQAASRALDLSVPSSLLFVTPKKEPRDNVV
jgi:hypothetical protein